MVKKILFLTGSRADFGKLRPLMHALEKERGFKLYIFVTGMHMLPKYGNTASEVKKRGFKKIHYFINQKLGDSLDTIFTNTVQGLGNYLHLLKPDMLVIHGDRTEALAGAISGVLNNFFVAHIEGGEVSGAIDESIRHAVSKLAHVHFAANDEARKRLLRMGEDPKSINVIGSPDIDLMVSDSLPALDTVKRHYAIPFKDKYAMCIYHPVSHNLHNLLRDFRAVMESLIESGRNYILIYPNNDPGADIIIEEIELYRGNPRFRIFPSTRFESFLVLLKHCEFIIGNSSAGIREAPIYSIPSVNIGNRQERRYLCDTIINCLGSKEDILTAINKVPGIKKKRSMHFGDGKSAERFIRTVKRPGFWDVKLQKYFVDTV
ncbi:MAG: UDP-N-acetylglucosamine 2-epimerase (hydrolyzing) [Candidatus Omnitrophica bacterium]|nr:UDP-N-acetylglucosamine 2-epimerase (hydrolyzing) [Candidatus Omnitrophota bacterium]